MKAKRAYISNGREYISNINNIAILPKGCDYDWRCVESGHFAIIEFECDKSYTDIFSFNVKNGETYLKTIKQMEIDRALKKTTYMLDEFKNLYSLILSVLKTREKNMFPPAKNKKFFGQLNISPKITISIFPTKNWLSLRIYPLFIFGNYLKILWEFPR